MAEKYIQQQKAVYSNTLKVPQEQGNSQSDWSGGERCRVSGWHHETSEDNRHNIKNSAPSVSLILPLKTMILKSMDQNVEDIPAVREIKHVIRENLQNRYSDAGLQDFLHKCTALDPRFKTLPHLKPAWQKKKSMRISSQTSWAEWGILTATHSDLWFNLV